MCCVIFFKKWNKIKLDGASLSMKNLLQYKIIIIFLLVIIVSGCVAVTDSRLSGKWRSNLELTTKYNEEHAILTQKQKKVFSQLFGHMEITYSSPNKCGVFMPKLKIGSESKAFELDEIKETGEYKILYKDEKVIVILDNGHISGESKTQTLHFVDETTYWVYVADSKFIDLHIREYFTKVE